MLESGRIFVRDYSEESPGTSWPWLTWILRQQDLLYLNRFLSLLLVQLELLESIGYQNFENHVPVKMQSCLGQFPLTLTYLFSWDLHMVQLDLNLNPNFHEKQLYGGFEHFFLV